MDRKEAIDRLQCVDSLDSATSIALDSLIAWDGVISELSDKIEFFRKCGAKDYAQGMDAALYIIQQHLHDGNIIC